MEEGGEGRENMVEATVSYLVSETERGCLMFDADVHSLSVLAVDTETTSLNGTVIQVGVIGLNHEGEEVFSASRLMRLAPNQRIDPGAQRVHGISHEKLEAEGEDGALCLKALKCLCDSAHSLKIPVVAHNLNFDRRSLERTASAFGTDPPLSSGVCTMELSKRAAMKYLGTQRKMKNSSLYELLVGTIPKSVQLHDAVEDARLTAKSWFEGRRQGIW